MLRTLLVVIGLIALVGAMAALVSSGSAATGAIASPTRR